MQHADVSLGPHRSILIMVEGPSICRIRVVYDDDTYDALVLDLSSCNKFVVRVGSRQIIGLHGDYSKLSIVRLAQRLAYLPRAVHVAITRRKRLRKLVTKFPLRAGGSISYFFTSKTEIRHHYRLHNALEKFNLSPFDPRNNAQPSIFIPLSRSEIQTFSEQPHSVARQSEKHRAAICIHAYFHDALPDILETISSLSDRPHIIATVGKGPEAERVSAALRDFEPNADVRVVENRGRDVWPFVKLLNSGAFDEFDLVCKIHTKSSSGSPQNKLLGEAWRRRALLDLLGSRRQVDMIRSLFAENEKLGMVGPSALRLPSVKAEDPANKHCRELRADLLRRMGQQRIEPTNFFAGTMFWVRPTMLQPLRDLSLQASEFVSEAEMGLEGLPHAIERVFADVVKLSGGTMANKSLRRECDLAGSDRTGE